MNTLERNRHTEAWSAAGRRFGKPKAILAISAHWYIRGTAVTAMAQPPTIHDFGGFPPALHAYQYPAPGDPALAARVQALLAPSTCTSIRNGDSTMAPGRCSRTCTREPTCPWCSSPSTARASGGFHYEMGQRLSALRDEGIMLVGSGNVVHNLARDAGAAKARPPIRGRCASTRPRATSSSATTTRRSSTISQLGDAAQMSVPTPEHYLPLLYIAGARREDDTLSILTDGIELGSISMLSFAYAP